MPTTLAQYLHNAVFKHVFPVPATVFVPDLHVQPLLCAMQLSAIARALCSGPPVTLIHTVPYFARGFVHASFKTDRKAPDPSPNASRTTSVASGLPCYSTGGGRHDLQKHKVRDRVDIDCQRLITMLTMFGELAVPLLCIGRNAPAPWLRASSGSTKFAPETSTSRLHLILPWRDLTSLPICYNTCHVCSAPSYMVAPESASQVGRVGRKVGLALKAMRNYQKAHATLCPNTNQINNI